MKIGNVRIVSDGTPNFTVVTVDGVEIEGVTSIAWEVAGFDHLATATLKIEGVAVDALVNAGVIRDDDAQPDVSEPPC